MCAIEARKSIGSCPAPRNFLLPPTARAQAQVVEICGIVSDFLVFFAAPV
jgi:hypothetical protein